MAVHWRLPLWYNNSMAAALSRAEQSGQPAAGQTLLHFIPFTYHEFFIPAPTMTTRSLHDLHAHRSTHRSLASDPHEARSRQAM